MSCVKHNTDWHQAKPAIAGSGSDCRHDMHKSCYWLRPIMHFLSGR